MSGLPEPMDVPPQDAEYQVKVPPEPPEAVRVMVVGTGPEQKAGVSTEAPVGAVGVGLTVTVRDWQPVEMQPVVVLRARAK